MLCLLSFSGIVHQYLTCSSEDPFSEVSLPFGFFIWKLSTAIPNNYFQFCALSVHGNEGCGNPISGYMYFTLFCQQTEAATTAVTTANGTVSRVLKLVAPYNISQKVSNLLVTPSSSTHHSFVRFCSWEKL